MKPSAKSTGEQRKMHQLLRDAGYRVEVCRGYQAAIRAINGYENLGEEGLG
jgi:hypothetical protein